MRAYELGIILDGGLDEPDARSWLKNVTDQVAVAGGSIVGAPDWWGRRRFAYPINRKAEGYYAFLNVLAEGGALDGLERNMRLADEVVRHKLIRLPDREAARRGMVDAGTAV
jgi:small subunit ribosomal protein S6